MRWIRFLLILAAAVVVIAGGTLALLLTLDPNDYKPQIENFVTSQTGRTLELDGHVGYELGALTSLELTDARFGNPPWASKPYMAKISRGKVTLDVRTLLKGPIVVELIELEDAELHLEALEDGTANWAFGTTDDSPSDATKEATSDPALPLVLRHVQGQDVLFTLTIPALPRPLIIHADHAVQDELPDKLLKASIAGTVNERAVTLSGTYGTLSDLLKAENLQYDIEGQLDTLTIRSKGRIDDLTGPKRPTLELDVNGPDIDNITDTFGFPDLGEGGLDLKASVRPETGSVTVEIRGNIGDYTTDTKFTATDLASLEHFALETSINGPDLGKVLEQFGVPDVPGGPFETGGKIIRDGNRIEIDDAHFSIGSTVLVAHGTINDFINLDDSRLQLRVNGTDIEQFRALIGIPGAAVGPFQISADLNVQPDGIELLDVHMQTNVATLKISGAIVGKSPDFIGTTLKFDGTGENLAEFSDVYDIPNAIAAPFAIRGKIELGDERLVSTETVTVEVGENRVSLDGTMGYAPLERDTNFRIHATGPDLAKIAAMGIAAKAGVTESVPALPFDVSAGLIVGPDGYRISNLSGTLGESKLTLDGVISKAANLAGTRATFSVAGPELGELISDTQLPDVGPDFGKGPFDVSGEVELLADSLRLERVRIKVADAAATLDANIGLPLESRSGRFDLGMSGPNLRAILPSVPRWNPPEAKFELRVTGALEQGLWTLDELTVRIADAHLEGSGVFDQPPNLSRTSLKLSTHIPTLSALGGIDKRLFPPTNVDVEMLFTGSPESFSIDPFHLQIGKGNSKGSMSLDLSGPVPNLDLRVISDVLDLESLVYMDPELEETVDDEEQARIDPPVDGRVIPDVTLPLEQLRQINARIDIDAKTLLFNDIAYTDVEIDGEVRDGRLVLERARGTTPFGDLAASMSLLPTEDSATFEAVLNAKGIYLGLGEARSAEEIEASPKLDANIDLSGAGLTLRELAASLNGSATVSTPGGRIPKSGASLFFGGFVEELLAAINLLHKEDPYTELRCLVLLLDVSDGLVAVDPGMVAQTDKMNIAAKGELNLANEKIDIGFKTAPRSRISISAGEIINPYLKVAGTLSEPKLQIDPTGAIISGGAAVATMGISILATGVWDRVFRASDPCAAAVKEAETNEEKSKRKKFLGIF